MKRTGLLIIVTGSVAVMSALTFTTVHAVQHNESPKQALVKAPKVAVQAVAHSIKKLAGSGAPRGLTIQSTELETTAESNEKAENKAAPLADAKIFNVIKKGLLLDSFDTFVDAVNFAKTQQNVKIVYKPQNADVWSNEYAPIGWGRINEPLIEQMPELERGCEVTSLAMLLRSAGVSADKMMLAQQIKKDPTPFQMKNGQRNFGNPSRGFIGDIETFDNPGYGVYHEPIKELADQYLPERVIDLSGADFSDVYGFLDQGIPVWTIVNVDYDTLSDDQFEQWITPDGPINITYKEHSVLVTGYDGEYIYINDPLNETDKVDKDSFIAAWEQMGRQAISYVPKLESKAGKT